MVVNGVTWPSNKENRHYQYKLHSVWRPTANLCTMKEHVWAVRPILRGRAARCQIQWLHYGGNEARNTATKTKTHRHFRHLSVCAFKTPKMLLLAFVRGEVLSSCCCCCHCCTLVRTGFKIMFPAVAHVFATVLNIISQPFKHILNMLDYHKSDFVQTNVALL